MFRRWMQNWWPIKMLCVTHPHLVDRTVGWESLFLNFNLYHKDCFALIKQILVSLDKDSFKNSCLKPFFTSYWQICQGHHVWRCLCRLLQITAMTAYKCHFY